jgi:hypothetical protein
MELATASNGAVYDIKRFFYIGRLNELNPLRVSKYHVRSDL